MDFKTKIDNILFINKTKDNCNLEGSIEIQWALNIDYNDQGMKGIDTYIHPFEAELTLNKKPFILNSKDYEVINEMEIQYDSLYPYEIDINQDTKQITIR